MYSYIVETVSKTWPMRNVTTVMGESAQSVMEKYVATGDFRRVEVAPASEVNGYDGTLRVKHGDTAAWRS